MLDKIYLSLTTGVLILALSFLSAGSFFASITGNELGAGLLSGVNFNAGGLKIGKMGIGISAGPGGTSLNLTTDDTSLGQQPGCGAAGASCLTMPNTGAYYGVARETSFRAALQKWVSFFLGFFSLIAMIALIYAGFQYVTAAGDDEQAGKAKKGIIFTTIGIIVVLMAYAIVNTLITDSPRGGDLVQGNLLQILDK